MTDYNDGKWHGWNGGDMKPASVHEETVIDYVWFDECDERELCGTRKNVRASAGVGWSQVVKFRVIKEHKEPRECLVNFETMQFRFSTGPLNDAKYLDAGYVYAREVIE